MDPIAEVLQGLKAAGPRLEKPVLIEMQARLARQLTFLGQLQAACFPEAVAAPADRHLPAPARARAAGACPNHNGVPPAIAATPPAIETNGHARLPDPDLVVGCLSGCGRLANGSRGLCNSCHTRTTADVKARKVTWEELVRSGKALPDRSWRQQELAKRSMATAPADTNGHAWDEAAFAAAWEAADTLDEAARQLGIDKRLARNRAAQLRRKGRALKRFPRRGDEGWQEPPRAQRPPNLCRCGCGHKVNARGLAAGCYKAARKLVQYGHASWDGLLAADDLRARLTAGATDKVSSAGAGDHVRRSLATYLLQSGKATVGMLAEFAELKWDEIHKITKHPWFDRQADGIHLTHEGRLAVADQPDDD